MCTVIHLRTAYTNVLRQKDGSVRARARRTVCSCGGLMHGGAGCQAVLGWVPEGRPLSTKTRYHPRKIFCCTYNEKAIPLSIICGLSGFGGFQNTQHLFSYVSGALLTSSGVFRILARGGPRAERRWREGRGAVGAEGGRCGRGISLPLGCGLGRGLCPLPRKFFNF